MKPKKTKPVLVPVARSGNNKSIQSEIPSFHCSDLLNKTQEMAHIGSWELDIDSGKLSWTDEVFRIFGFDPQEFSPTHDIFMSSVHPDDRDAFN